MAPYAIVARIASTGRPSGYSGMASVTVREPEANLASVGGSGGESVANTQCVPTPRPLLEKVKGPKLPWLSVGVVSCDAIAPVQLPEVSAYTDTVIGIGGGAAGNPLPDT
jgi:hypothetical protein